MATAASAQAESPVAAAASATAEPYMAFHSVRILSSSPGLTRVARDANRICRPDSTMPSPRRAAPTGRRRMLLPSKFPSGVTPNQSISASAIAASAAVGPVDPFGDGGGHLFRGPDVEPALDTLGVGVLGRVHAALGGGQVPADVGDDAGHDVEIVLAAGDLPAVEEGAQQAGLVVEHLLEVGHQPFGVGRVAGEATPEVVVDAARGHGVQGGDGHVPGVGGGRDPLRLGASGRGPGPPRPAGGTWGHRRIRPTAGRSGRPTPPVRWPTGRSHRPGRPADANNEPAPSGRWISDLDPMARHSWSACSSTSLRRLSQTSVRASSTVRKPGSPGRSAGGK